MPGLIPLIKKVRPELPVVYRSHIEIRSDLVHRSGSPQEEVWKYLWNNIQLADLFISNFASLCSAIMNLTNAQVTLSANLCQAMCLQKNYVLQVLLPTGKHEISRGGSVIHFIHLGSMVSARNSIPGMKSQFFCFCFVFQLLSSSRCSRQGYPVLHGRIQSSLR